MNTRAMASLVLAAGFGIATGTNTTTTTVDFTGGVTAGWIGPAGPGGATFIDVEDGTPAPSLRTIFNNFGITFYNATNPVFVQDFTQYDSVAFSVDVLVREVAFFGMDVSRPWLIELRDFDSGAPGYPWASVWFKFDDIAESTHGAWTTFSVTIDDPNAVALPPGWGGYGDEDPVTFEPVLPAGVTFAQILAGVDEIALTTFEPGFFFGFTDFDVAIDTIRVSTTSKPGGCNPADLAEPFGVLDLADIQAFVTAFTAQDPAADLAEPFGIWDLADVQTFAGSFVAGCP